MPSQTNSQPAGDVRVKIATLLGREPRGLEEVALFSACGEPMVIRVASLVDNAPFPNLFWLIDPQLVYRIDGDEAGGLIQQMQTRVDADPQLQASLVSDHLAHIKLRNGFMTPAIEAQLRSLNYYEVLQQRGIGGIADFGRIRCLHTWYAAHLLVPNTVGLLLEAHWREAQEKSL